MHHILEGRITDTTLRQFIYNFSTHNLNRALNSPKQRKNISCAEQTCISELNTQNFLTTVMQPHKVCVNLFFRTYNIVIFCRLLWFFIIPNSVFSVVVFPMYFLL